VSPGNPDAIVYRPIPVFDFGRYSSSGWPELTSLLVDMARRGDARGVVVRARSGSGKTMAQFKAFWDCTRVPKSDEKADTALAGLGHVPCRLNGNVLPNTDADLIERMLVREANVEGWYSIATLKDWLLGDSQRLLLFCDLNAVSEGKLKVEQHLTHRDRNRLARGLDRFQALYGPRGHRCVVGYRSERSSDGVMNQLGDQFRSIDLRPLSLEDANRYLRSFRLFEVQVIRRIKSIDGGGPGLSMPLPAAAIEPMNRVVEDVTKPEVRSLVSNLGDLPNENADDSAPESLISTPLLKHFFSLIGGEDSRKKVKNVTDLYRSVVIQHI
jgi:hypothetical protein